MLVFVDHYTASRENVKTKVILCETQFSHAHKLLVRILKGCNKLIENQVGNAVLDRVLQVGFHRGRVGMGGKITSLDLLATFPVLLPIVWLIFLISLSLLRILKSINAKMELWGAPLVTSLHLDIEPLIMTLCSIHSLI